MQKNPFGLKEDNPSQRNWQNQLSRISWVIEECHYCSHKEQMSGEFEFDSRKDSHPTKLERRPRILAKLSFKELSDLKLNQVYLLLLIWSFQLVKKELKIGELDCEFMRHWSLKKILWPLLRTHLLSQMTPKDPRNIHSTGNSCRDMALKLPQYFNLVMGKSLGFYFRVWSQNYQETQCNQKTPLKISIIIK